MGDLYNGKVGFIESLTYTFPDTGNWEIVSWMAVDYLNLQMLQ